MAENQILPFAQGTSANVQTQTAYAGDVQRLSGNQPGIARSAFVNKTLRQCAAMSAGLGQYIADRQSVNVTDAMTPPQVAAALANSVGATIPAASYTVAGKIMIATPEQAQALSDNTRAISPAILKEAFTRKALLQQSGYQILPSGLIMQWGRVENINDGDSIMFPIAYTQLCYGAWFSFAGTPRFIGFISREATGLTVRIIDVNGAPASVGVLFWLAFGV